MALEWFMGNTMRGGLSHKPPKDWIREASTLQVVGLKIKLEVLGMQFSTNQSHPWSNFYKPQLLHDYMAASAYAL